MAPPDPPHSHPDAAVPDMVNDYRAQLDALRSQARDLARMRADVLAAADRESQAIVTSARSDIREILVRARRELLVLAAQVQAVTEQEVPQALGAGADAAPHQERLSAGAPSEARQEVRHVLTEARPDLDALAIEAKILRANLLALRAPDAPAPRAISTPAPPDIDMPSAPAAPPQPTTPGPMLGHHPAQASTRTDVDDFVQDAPPPALGAVPHTDHTTDEGQEETRPGRTMSPVIRSLDPAPSSGTSTGRVFVAAFAVLAALVVAGTGWWFSSQRPPTTDTTMDTQASAPQSPPGPGGIATPAAASTEDVAPAAPSLIIEARGDSWIRAQIDGRPDAGRLYSAGETRTITGASRVSIRAGDAGAVYVGVNGGAIEPLGPAGKPLTRDFVLTEPPSEPSAQPEPIAPPHDDVDSPTSLEATPTALPAPRAANSPVAGPAPRTANSPAAEPATRTASSPVAGPASSTAPAPPPAPAAQPDTLAAGSATPQEDELVGLSRRWLDAYLSGNSSTMLAVSGGTPDIRDQRPANERTPAVTGSAARRVFEAPRLQRGADIGVFSVRMTERPPAGTASERVALVSQVWMRRTGKWQLIDVRIVSESQNRPAP